jgi:hypothetical protein
VLYTITFPAPAFYEKTSLPEPTDEQIEAAGRNGRGLMRKLPDNWACPCCDRTTGRR